MSFQNLLDPSITYFKPNYRKRVPLVWEGNSPPVTEFDKNIECPIPRPITEFDRNIECPISLEIIGINCEYCQCATCKYNFLSETFFAINANKCPICKCGLTNKLVFVNNDKYIPSNHVPKPKSTCHILRIGDLISKIYMDLLASPNDLPKNKTCHILRNGDLLASQLY